MNQSEQSMGLTQPKTYFDLISKIGSKGNYQRNIFVIFYIIWFIAGIIMMGTSFLFMGRQYQCEEYGIITDNCQQYVCQHFNQTQRQKFMKPSLVYSLSINFGPFQCEKALRLSELKMAPYLGTFFGYFLFLYIADNYGRKKSIVLSWSFTTMGAIITCLSWNIQVAIFGLFLTGTGCQPALRIIMTILGQVVEYHRRQSYSILIELSFGTAGISIGLNYWLFYNWRSVFIIFVTIPSIIVLFFLIFYLQQTPVFLIKKSKEFALKALNRIGKINKGESSIITMQDIESVVQNQCDEKDQFGKMKMTPLDLCRYQSLRRKAVLCSIVFFAINFLYFGPIFIVDRFGFNPFVSQAILSSCQLFAYPLAFIFISRSKRRLNGIIFFGLSAIFSGILIFIEQPQKCSWCTESIIELVMVFLMRFCISYYFAILFLYITELFPRRIRAIGFGMASAIGALAPSVAQPMLQQLQQRTINPMIIFSIMGIIAMISVNFLQETHNEPLKDQIDEILVKKQLIKTTNAEKNTNQEQSKKDETQQQQPPKEFILLKSQSSKYVDGKHHAQKQDFPVFQIE